MQTSNGDRSRGILSTLMESYEFKLEAKLTDSESRLYS